VERLYAWLCLKSAPGLKPKALLDIIRKYPFPEEYVGQSAHLIYSDESISDAVKEHLTAAIKHPRYEQISKLCAHYDIKMLCYGEEDYPIGLRDIISPPLVLYYRGDLPACLKQLCLAVVGTRKPSPYGRDICARLLEPVCKQQLTIVSGLAAGIDSVAHTTAVKNNALTVAVLGSGVETIYPAHNKELSDKIIAHGALVSEYEPGTKLDAWNFPARNRIVSALAQKVFIVEGSLESGAMLTAKFALEQGRDILALPGEINKPNAQGPNYLIKNGAQCVTTPEDILFSLGLDIEKNAQLEALPDISPDEQKVFDLFKSEQREISFDELLLLTGHNFGKLSTILLNLELKNYLRKTGGNTFSL
jgi:DNA processing protein